MGLYLPLAFRYNTYTDEKIIIAVRITHSHATKSSVLVLKFIMKKRCPWWECIETSLTERQRVFKSVWMKKPLVIR